MATYKNRIVERKEIIDKIKKYFPQFKLNENETVLTVYDKEIHIVEFNPTKKYSGQYEGAELLSLIIENILWYKNIYENKLDLYSEVDMSKIIEMSNKELDLLIEKGIYNES